MSRVHDALRRAEQLLDSDGQIEGPATPDDRRSLVVADEKGVSSQSAIDVPNPVTAGGLIRTEGKEINVNWRDLLSRCKVIPFHPAPETHLIDQDKPHEVPAEEFRSLRTRLNHLQTQRQLHSLVVTSASPAEGKSFTAVNLALAQAQLETPVLLADLDLRRPTVHNLLQCERTPGFSDFLLAERPLEDCIRRIGNTNLYFMPAGSQVKNPLEILNLRHVKQTLDGFRKIFNWIVLDTPPLLFSADANLLSTMTDGTIIVVRIGSTTYDNVIRAMQTLCEDNVIGIVANGARAGELYSKYTYYYSKPDDEDGVEIDPNDGPDPDATDFDEPAMPVKPARRASVAKPVEVGDEPEVEEEVAPPDVKAKKSFWSRSKKEKVTRVEAEAPAEEKPAAAASDDDDLFI
jgi:protein-tyrosine kinase